MNKTTYLEDIYDPRIKTAIQTTAARIKNLPMEKEDIQQEFYIAIISYFAEVPNPSDRSMGAINRVINQKLYRLIRHNVKFEGCSEKSRKIRKELNAPFSLDQPIKTKDGEEFTLMSVIKKDIEYNHFDEMALRDFIKNFKTILTSKELHIFNLMLEGINKPRFVCESLYGEDNINQRKCKTISKHMINIKSKFKDEWLVKYGRVLNF